MTNDALWYAVYTKPRWEKKVADLLARKGVEHYCPLNRVVRKWADRKKTVEEPLFKSYVFIRCTAAELLKVKQIDGVVNLVYWLGKPAVIRDEEIATIKDFLEQYKTVKLQRTEVELNKRVSINDGPLVNYVGQVVEVKNKLIKVQLPSLGYALIFTVSKENVSVICMDTDYNGHLMIV